MAQYSELSAAQISELLNTYLVGELASYTVLSGGSENTNYLVTTTESKFVLTVCEQKTIAETTALANLLQHLADHQFFTTQIIPNKDNELVSTIQNKPVLLKTFIEGSIIQDQSSDILTSLGQQLAQLHNIPAPSYLPKKVAYGKEKFSNVENYAKGSDFQSWLYNIRDRVNAKLTSDLPKALIHSDIFFDNIVVSPDAKTATIMDFEEAAYYYRIFDIGMMLVGVCGDNSQLNLEKSASVLAGYSQIIKLQSEEEDALQVFCAYAAAGTGYWRHQQYNYLMPEPEMANHYLAMTSLADQILTIPDANFRSIFPSA